MAVVIGEPSIEDPKAALLQNSAALETFGGNELTAADHMTKGGTEMANVLDLLHQAIGSLGVFEPEAEQAHTGHKLAADGFEDLAPKLAANVRTAAPDRRDAHDAVRRVAAGVEPAKEDTTAIKGYVDLGKSVLRIVKKAVKEIEDANAVSAMTTTAQGMTERGGNMKKDAETLSNTARDW